MNLKLRQESVEDYLAVNQLIKAAFAKIEFSDQTEHHLVTRLRKSEAFVPELSLVAIANNQVVGHILLSKIKIKSEHQIFDSLALAPVSVLPDFQNKGIGGELIEAAHVKAKELGFQSVILIGHADYYPRFGYELTEKYQINFPFEVPSENGMVKLLTEHALDGVSGEVVYPKEFA